MFNKVEAVRTTVQCRSKQLEQLFNKFRLLEQLFNIVKTVRTTVQYSLFCYNNSLNSYNNCSIQFRRLDC